MTDTDDTERCDLCDGRRRVRDRRLVGLDATLCSACWRWLIWGD